MKIVLSKKGKGLRFSRKVVRWIQDAVYKDGEGFDRSRRYSCQEREWGESELLQPDQRTHSPINDGFRHRKYLLWQDVVNKFPKEGLVIIEIKEPPFGMHWEIRYSKNKGENLVLESDNWLERRSCESNISYEKRLHSEIETLRELLKEAYPYSIMEGDRGTDLYKKYWKVKAHMAGETKQDTTWPWPNMKEL